MKIFWKYKLYGNKNNHQLYMINETKDVKLLTLLRILTGKKHPKIKLQC